MVCYAVFEVQPDCILDVAQSLVVCVSLAVTALEQRAGDIETLRIAFDDNRQRVALHGDIVLREATGAVRKLVYTAVALRGVGIKANAFFFAVEFPARGQTTLCSRWFSSCSSR